MHSFFMRVEVRCHMRCVSGWVYIGMVLNSYLGRIHKTTLVCEDIQEIAFILNNL
jgi:hypothetical protein